MFGTLPIYQVTIDSTAGEPNIYGTRRWWYNFQQPRNLFPYPPVFPNIAIAGRISSFSIESIYRLNQRVQPFHPAMFVHRSVMFCFPPQKKRSKHPRLQVYNLKSLTKKWQLSNNPQPAIFSPIFCGEKKKGRNLLKRLDQIQGFGFSGKSTEDIPVKWVIFFTGKKVPTLMSPPGVWDMGLFGPTFWKSLASGTKPTLLHISFGM